MKGEWVAAREGEQGRPAWAHREAKGEESRPKVMKREREGIIFSRIFQKLFEIDFEFHFTFGKNHTSQNIYAAACMHKHVARPFS